MINSKAVKNSCFKKNYDSKPKSKLATIVSKFIEFIRFKIYYPPIDWFTIFTERLSRSLDYAKFGWLNYDFDFAYVYSILSFKLKRLYKVLENGHLVQSKDDLKALKESIKISDRLFNNNYEDVYFKIHDRKWGKLQTKTIPNHDENGKVISHSWKSWRKNTKNATKIIKEKERKEFLECVERGEFDRKIDIDKLTYFLKKYSLRLWD